MAKLAANLTMMFTHLPFLDRFAAAAQAGFRAVEFQFPYDEDAGAIRRAADEAGVRVVLFNLSPGNWATGERGFACLPGRDDDWDRAVTQALDYASALDCQNLHAMAGFPPADMPRETALDLYCKRLALAAERAHAEGRRILIEALNSSDVPGYLILNSDDAAAIIARVGHPALRLQFDLYHAQIMEGDLTRRMERLLPIIGHVQIAAVPDRNEPDQGECNPHHLLNSLDRLGYGGWVGCEYRPSGDTVAGLGWAARYL